MYEQTSIRVLDHWLANTEVSKPLDVHNLFGTLTHGQANNFNKALRAYLNFLELTGMDGGYLDSLRKAIPSQKFGADTEVPPEEAIIASLALSAGLMPKYRASFNLLLDSGLRVTEAAKLIGAFKAEKAQPINGFYRYTTNYLSGSKNSFAAYFTEPT